RALGAAWSSGEAGTGGGMVTGGGMRCPGAVVRGRSGAGASWCQGEVVPGRSGARAKWRPGVVVARGRGSDLVGVEVAEPGLVGDDRDLDPVGAVELREDLRDVRLHGRLAHEQPHADLRVRQPGADRAE